MKANKLLVLTLAGLILAVTAMGSATASYPWFVYDQRSTADLGWTQQISESGSSITAQPNEQLHLNNYWYNYAPSYQTMYVQVALKADNSGTWHTHLGSQTISHGQGLSEWAGEETAHGSIGERHYLINEHSYITTDLTEYSHTTTSTNVKQYGVISA